MHRIDINEADWKLYRSRITVWQELYMERLCQEYAAVLTSDKNASDKFWAIFDRIKVDGTKTGVIARNARSSMISNIVNLLQECAITDKDLEGFSDELIERVKFIENNKV
ncbi:MAG: multidrug transporter [Ruminococcus sp.]|nr:multidrug transporter [Ruminococcus sp.]MBR3970025.1 multidrug transporter [Ruminococcus sp.]